MNGLQVPGVKTRTLFDWIRDIIEDMEHLYPQNKYDGWPPEFKLLREYVIDILRE